MRYEESLIIRLVLAFLTFLLYDLFYAIFSPLTLFFSFVLLKWLNYSPTVNLATDSIIVYGHTLNFIPACTAASAYFLLVLLILLTKDIKISTRIYMFLLGSFLILAMNIIRIDVLIIVLIKYSKDFFDNLHLLFWKIISTVFVAFVWIILTIIFKIKTIPVVSDITYLIDIIRKR
ncbi:MAG: pacearchaeosortase [Candidatus Woesearchaeota archaeon]